MDSAVLITIALAIPSAMVTAWIVKLSVTRYVDIPKLAGIFILVWVLTSLLAMGIGAGVKYGSMHDVEVWNGQVVGKERRHGSYTRPYDCHCTTNKEGHQTCMTCYEDRYTVSWDVYTTLGSYNIESHDTTSRSIWLKPDPVFYSKAAKGDPVSEKNSYKNILLGLPREYWYTNNTGASPELLAKMPDYPNIYAFYNINRVLDIDNVLPAGAAQKLDRALANGLRERGSIKQVNVNIIFTKDVSANTYYALREKWIGGKNNDVTLVVSAPEYPKIEDVRVLTYAKNELFKIQLQDELRGTIDSENSLLRTTFKHIDMGYQRPQMEDFEYLEDLIDIGNTARFFIFALLFIGPIGAFVITRLKR